jgi:hypothetical protein
MNDNGLFNLKEEVKPTGVRFAFVEGNRHNKANVALPMRISITVARNPGKLMPAVSVKATKQGLYLKLPNRDAKKRWTERINAQLKPEKD